MKLDYLVKVLILILILVSSLFLFSKEYLSIFSKNVNLNNNSNFDNSDLNQSKIVAVTFAGRKKFVEISLNYIKNLILHQKIHEMHYWLFTNNEEDREFFKQIGNIHKTSKNFADYQEIFPQIINNEVTIFVKIVFENKKNANNF